MSVDIHLDRTVSTAEPFVAKLVMVMHYRGPECHAKKIFFFFFCYLQGQGHNEGSCDQI